MPPKEDKDESNLALVGIDDTTQYTDLTLHNTGLINIRICPTGSEDVAYYVNNSTFKPNIPDITLYQGPDKDGPIIGVSHLTVSGTNTIGLGDSEGDVNAMVWENLERTSKWTHADYQYDFALGGGLETRTTFEWRRLKKTFLGAYCLQLVELSNPGVILGAFIPGPGMRVKIRGRILIKKGYGEDWERMALLTGLSLVELTRRRARQRRAP